MDSGNPPEFVLNDERICIQCLQSKPLATSFDNHKRRCRKCVSANQMARKKADSDYRERMNRSYRKHQLKKKFGMTPADYNRLFHSQGGCCAICRRPETGKHPRGVNGIARLAIDHCHKSGKVRGLLCMNCNHLLGKAKDDPMILNAAATYLLANR